MKGGGDVTILRTHQQADCERMCRRDIDEVIRVHRNSDSNIAGWALVVWSSDGASTVTQQGGGIVPGILVGDFARSRLLADRIERWTRQGLEEPSPDGAA